MGNIKFMLKLRSNDKELEKDEGPAYSGFDWNDDAKCIIAKKEVFDNLVRSHPVTKGLLNKPFPYYDELTYVFGCARATGHFAETFANIRSNEPVGYEEFDMPNGNEEFPSMYSQGIDMFQEDVRASRSSHASEGRVGSSKSKRKRESQREGEIEVIHMALE
ncbi:retrotransposon protein [Cucumis melo var. makuwa]|uniref:Retrotransposon protein n=1 Tax=Cucumis melo var. makuwa TaxID=1194695 RepID=A0A5A7SRG8_CUCMM|nr:retrotransposon protein [Cucumis melo var. makuwa]TYK14386.1 retrotransposon protein [Cucumis melo var. makuwa]